MKRMVFCLLVTVLLIPCFTTGIMAWTGGVMSGNTFYISGKGDQIPGGGHPETFPEQVRQCLENVRSTIESAGLDMTHVVKSWVYLDDIENFEAMNKEYVKFFPKDAPPARTTVDVGWIPGGSHIEITCIAYTDLSEKKKVGGEAALGLPFSPGILAGNTLYISGQGDHLPDGGHPETFEKQARQCMFRVGEVLKEAGLDWRHVVWSTIYIDQIGYENFGVMNKVYSEFFAFGHEPARVTVFVDKLPVGSHIEVTCTAAADLSSRRVVRPPSMEYGYDETAPTASPGVWAGDTLYLSAQTGFVPAEGLVSNDLESQTRQMMQNHLDVLKQAGLGFEHIVSGNVYLRDGDDYSSFNTLYHPYFDASPGVRTCVQGNSGYANPNEIVQTSFIMSKEKK